MTTQTIHAHSCHLQVYVVMFIYFCGNGKLCLASGRRISFHVFFLPRYWRISDIGFERSRSWK